MRSTDRWFFSSRDVLLVLTSIVCLEAASWAAAPGRQELLKKLVEEARREGELVIWGVNSLGDDGAKAYGEAFKARFGLNNIRLKYDFAGDSGGKISQAIVERRMGLPPTYDAMYATEDWTMQLIEASAVESIEHWEVLLPEGVSPKFSSPGPVAGQAFVFGHRTKGNVYNTKVIPEKEMPQTTRDVGLPKYKGKFYTSPWTTAPIFGILVYSKEEWLEIMRAWGQNKAATVRPAGGIQRMMMGEFAFEPFSNSYLYFQHKEKGSPAGLDVFADITPLAYILHAVRKDARHPNAAKLFALWATGPEAVQIFEKYTGTGNVHLKESRVGVIDMEVIRKKKARLISWFDSAENMRVLKWYTTEEGQAYEEKISLALRLK